ncbi:unnamed protein product [Soboliphyme baturini]|uniref:Secreted protein n=1 Tax=Soboliphyme baturini TaxID=241478 RepID=A0A183IJ52_9BILA|nr:unnamed protein product [Soboliphyme baturini]
MTIAGLFIAAIPPAAARFADGRRGWCFYECLVNLCNSCDDVGVKKQTALLIGLWLRCSNDAANERRGRRETGGHGPCPKATPLISLVCLRFDGRSSPRVPSSVAGLMTSPFWSLWLCFRPDSMLPALASASNKFDYSSAVVVSSGSTDQLTK